MQANQLLCRNITSALCSFEYRRKHGWSLPLNVAFWSLPFADAQQDAVGSAFSHGHVTHDVCDPIPTGPCKASSPAYSTAPFLGKPLSTAGLRGAHWDCSHTAAFQPVCSASPSPPREPPRAGMGFSCHLSHSFPFLVPSQTAQISLWDTATSCSPLVAFGSPQAVTNPHTLWLATTCFDQPLSAAMHSVLAGGSLPPAVCRHGRSVLAAPLGVRALTAFVPFDSFSSTESLMRINF